MNSIEPRINLFKIGFKNETTVPVLQCPAQRHVGSIVESVIRRRGYNISKLARNLKISRCTLYNWFQLESLTFDILARIGYHIDYDFSGDFPELFGLNHNAGLETDSPPDQHIGDEKADYWKIKYILLLEKYNACLLSQNQAKEYNEV